MRTLSGVLAAALLAATGLAASSTDVNARKIPDRIRQGHPRMFFNADTWPGIKARAERDRAKTLGVLLRACDRFTDNPVCTGMEPPKPRLVKTKSGIVEIPPNPSTGIPSINEFGCQAAECALAWRFTGKRKYLDKTVKMLKANIKGYEEAYRNRRAVNWYSTTRISSLCAYDWIYEALTPEERAEIIVPLLKHVEAAQDPKLKIHRRNGGSGHTGGFYGVASLPWYAALAAYGDGICDDLAAKMLELGYSNAMRMLEYRNDGAGDDGSLGGCCLGYCLGSYPWAHFNFFHTYLSATGKNIAGDYPNMALFPNWVWWMWIPNAANPRDPFTYGIGDTYHVTNLIRADGLYEHMSQYIFFYRDVYPEAARLAASLRERAPNRSIGRLQFGNSVSSGGWSIYPFLLSEVDGVEPFPDEKLETSQVKARHFEKLGHFLMRSEWRPGGTFCAFLAGGTLTQHKHRDENSFIIYKHDFLALDTGTRANQVDFNLKYYYAQSVAHNTILIHKPGEPLPRHWGPACKDPGANTNYGGQYSGFPAEVKAFETNPRFTYVASDAAKSYGAKCRRALRQFVHVQPDYFIVYDRVENDAPYRTEWLLHTQNEPAAIGSGIMRADSRKGRLFSQTFLPADAAVEKVGGEGREFWANGRNWEVEERYLESVKRTCEKEGVGPYLGNWRIEVTAREQKPETRFLHVLTATDTSVERPIAARFVKDGLHDGVELTMPDGSHLTFMFNRTGEPGGEVREGGKSRPLATKVQPQKGILL